MSKAYIFLANGFELIEAFTPLDVLRRCCVETITVSISGSDYVASSNQVLVKSDGMVNDSNQSTFKDADMIILPGGYPGYVNLGKSEIVRNLLKYYYEKEKYIAAICGAPLIIAVNNIAKGSKITCHSSVRDQITGYDIIDTNIADSNGVIIDNRLITGVGAGHSLDFAFELAQLLTDKATVNEVKRKMECSVL